MTEAEDWRLQPLLDPCETCLGKGRIRGIPCPECRGSGTLDPGKADPLDLSIFPATGTQRRKVLDCFWVFHPRGMTDFEVSIEIRILRSSASKRRGELVEGLWIEETGQKRKTDTDHLAKV